MASAELNELKAFLGGLKPSQEQYAEPLHTASFTHVTFLAAATPQLLKEETGGRVPIGPACAIVAAAQKATAGAAGGAGAAAAAPGLLTLAQLVDGCLPSLPVIATASVPSERRLFPYYPDCVQWDVQYFEGAMHDFRSSLDVAPSTACFRPVEFLGTNRPGAADSEGGVGLYFGHVTRQCEEVLKQQGHTTYGYVALVRARLLSQLVSTSGAQAAEPAAADAAAAAVAVLPEAEAAGITSAASVVEAALSSRRCSSSSDADAGRGKPDLILAAIPDPSNQEQHSSSSVPGVQRLQQRVVAFGELKVRETLTNNDDPVDLVALYEAGDPKAKSVIGQAFSYIVQLRVRLGFITCYDVTWLLEKRDDKPGVLYISAPIRAAAAAPQPTLMLAMCWLQHTAITDTRDPPSPPHAFVSSSAGPGNGSSGRPGSADRDNAGGSSWGSSRLRGPEKRSSGVPGHLTDYVSGSQLSDADMPSDQLRGQPAGEVLHLPAHEPATYQLPGLPGLPLVPLGCLEPSGAVLGSGATSIVLQGRFQGQICAIKLLLPEDSRCFAREVAAYQHLRVLQGSCLPKLLGAGLTCQGACCFLALELVRGMPLGCGMGISKAVACAAVNALQQIHDLGYVHGDVRLENMLQQDSPSSSGAVLVDLGRARPGSVQERDMEMVSLRQLLDLAP